MKQSKKKGDGVIMRVFNSLSNLTKMEKMNGTYYKKRYPDAREILKNKDRGIYREFINICKMSQEDLKKYLDGRIREYGYSPVNEEGFLYAEGNIPVLLTAHMDTVHKELVKKFFIITTKDRKHIITSPQGIGGDDRCGIYIILKVLEAGFRPYILFCEDEESGGDGSELFTMSDHIEGLTKLKYMIELDRANRRDAVFYNCDNDEFTDYITNETGYTENWGTFSDISNLAPKAKVAAVNLSVGYYHAHTVNEEVVYEEMMETEKTVEKLLTVADKCEQFEYKEGYSWYSYNGSYGKHYAYASSSTTTTKGNVTDKKKLPAVADDYKYYYNCQYDDYECVELHVTFENDRGEVEEDYIYAETEGDAWRDFFFTHQTVCWTMVLDYEYDRC